MMGGEHSEETYQYINIAREVEDSSEEIDIWLQLIPSMNKAELECSSEEIGITPSILETLFEEVKNRGEKYLKSKQRTPKYYSNMFEFVKLAAPLEELNPEEFAKNIEMRDMRSKKTVALDLNLQNGHKGVAHELQGLGLELNLGLLYHEKKYIEVFFRTVSGNIYHLSNDKKISNGRNNNGSLSKKLLSKEHQRQNLVIGKEFSTPNGQTTRIAQIVALEYYTLYFKHLQEENNIALDYLKMSNCL